MNQTKLGQTKLVSILGFRPLALIKEILLTIKHQGLAISFQKYRWKLVATIFIYYLVRDTFIYLILPSLTFYAIQIASKCFYFIMISSH